MNNNERNLVMLGKIIGYCDEIKDAVSLFGDSYELFHSNSVYKNAVAMCVLQIGELSGRLTDGFKAEYSGMPWKQIRGMRNVVAHEYGGMDTEELWNTVKEDIPELRKYCEGIVAKL